MDNIPALNLRVLSRHNPNITSLIDKSSYCVIYTFSTATASWTKAGYEGPLFIYSQRPHVVQTEEGEVTGGLFGFCVLNRLSLENFWGEINGGDIVLDDQYIITRSLTEEIYGLWLYEIDDRPRIFNILNELNHQPQQLAPATYGSAQEQPSTSIDINTLFKNAAEPPKSEQEPPANQLPSVDRLTQLFSRAMTTH